MVRVSVLATTLALALAVSDASRALRPQVDTSGLTFSDLHGNVAEGLSFDALAASSGGVESAPGTVREVTVDSSASSSAASRLDYSRPTMATFYDLVGDLSSKWSSFGDLVPVPGGSTIDLTTSCATGDLNACLLTCATTCFGNNACQWFTLQPVTKSCSLYRSLRPVAGDTFTAVPTAQQLIAGYVKAGVPALLSAKAACTKTVVYNEKDSFCVTADTTYFIAPSTAATTAASATKCAGSPMTLLRTFQNNFFNKGTDTSMTEELKNGKLINAKPMAPQTVGGDFSIDTFLDVIGGKEPLVVSTTDVVTDSAQQLTTTSSKTKWSYMFDNQGRVVSVASTLSKKNLLYTKDTTGKMAVRTDYCKPVTQTRFSYSIHALAAVTAQTPPLPFGGGEIASSLFTSPNGFWNLVPQSDNSRLTGCWKQANDAIAKLLEWGFTGAWSADVKYFKDPNTVKTQATEAAVNSQELFTEDDVDKYYTSTGSAVGDLGFQVDFPCGYMYRPYNMKATFKITDCEDGSYCSVAWPAIKKSKNAMFFSVSSSGDVQISRALAHWAFENAEDGSKATSPAFTYLKALATTSAGLCFTETGRSLASLTLVDQSQEVFLVVGEGKCVSLGEDGSPSVAACTATTTRYTVGGQGCLAGSGADCATFTYSKAFAAGQAITITKRDDLVTGTLTFGSKGCLVVDGSNASFSTTKTSCSPVQATYVTSTSIVSMAGDPIDPDAATHTVPVTQERISKPERIDDPDPELGF